MLEARIYPASLGFKDVLLNGVHCTLQVVPLQQFGLRPELVTAEFKAYTSQEIPQLLPGRCVLPTPVALGETAVSMVKQMQFAADERFKAEKCSPLK